MGPESRGSCVIYIRLIKLWVGWCGETGVEEKQEEAERGFKHLNKKLFDLRCWSRRRTELNKDVENFSERKKSRDDEFNQKETRTHDTTKPTRDINNVHTEVLENDRETRISTKRYRKGTRGGWRWSYQEAAARITLQIKMEDAVMSLRLTGRTALKLCRNPFYWNKRGKKGSSWTHKCRSSSRTTEFWSIWKVVADNSECWTLNELNERERDTNCCWPPRQAKPGAMLLLSWPLINTQIQTNHSPIQ